MSKRKADFQGKAVWAEEIEFETEREAWNTYLLHDGTRLKLKSVVSEVLRIEDMFNPDGAPVYMVNATNIVSTIVPEALKRKE